MKNKIIINMMRLTLMMSSLAISFCGYSQTGSSCGVWDCVQGGYVFYYDNQTGGEYWLFSDNYQAIGPGDFVHNFATSGSYDVTVYSDQGHTNALRGCTKFFYGLNDIGSLFNWSITISENPAGSNNYEFIYNGNSFTAGVAGAGHSFIINFGDGSYYTVPSGTIIAQNTVITTHTYSVSSNQTFSISVDHCFENFGEAPVCCSFDDRLDVLWSPDPCCSNFAPEVGGRYWLSAWVQEEHDQQVKTYEDSYVELEFIGGLGTVQLYPSGDIIEGWQRIVGEFTVPANTTDLKIHLVNDNTSINAFFDDIRVHPFNASMKSYVYDPVTLWLTAELDDNNYATFYEYDLEGQLIRIKKETARGIMTIQESRSSNPKEQ